MKHFLGQTQRTAKHEFRRNNENDTIFFLNKTFLIPKQIAF